MECRLLFARDHSGPGVALPRKGGRDGGAKDMVNGAQFDIMARLKAMAAPGKRCMKNIAVAARPWFGTVLPMPSDGGAAQGHDRSLLRVFCGRPPALRQIRVDAWVHPIFFWLGGCGAETPSTVDFGLGFFSKKFSMAKGRWRRPSALRSFQSKENGMHLSPNCLT